MSTQKSGIDRRSLLAGAALLGATLGSRSALAQQAEAPSVERLREILSTAQLREKLLEEMDLLVSVAAVTFSMAKKENPPATARAAYFALRGVLDSDGRTKVIEALSSREAPETVKRTSESIRGTLPRLRDLLTKDAGLSEPLADRLVGAFNVFTNLVAFAPANSDHWWCRCYGLGVIC